MLKLSTIFNKKEQIFVCDNFISQEIEDLGTVYQTLGDVSSAEHEGFMVDFKTLDRMLKLSKADTVEMTESGVALPGGYSIPGFGIKTRRFYLPFGVSSNVQFDKSQVSLIQGYSVPHKKENKLHLEGVYLSSEGGTCSAVSTNGHMMLVHDLLEQGLEKSFLIPVSILRKGKGTLSGGFGLGFTGKFVCLFTDNVIISFVDEGRMYPPYKEVFPKDEEVEFTGLSRVVDVVSALSEGILYFEGSKWSWKDSETNQNLANMEEEPVAFPRETICNVEYLKKCLSYYGPEETVYCRSKRRSNEKNWTTTLMFRGDKTTALMICLKPIMEG